MRWSRRRVLRPLSDRRICLTRGLTENIELNVQITGRPVTVLQEWYEEHWGNAEDVTPEILRVIDRHVREYSPFEVYARALHELFRRYEMTDKEWLENESRVYPILPLVFGRLVPAPGDNLLLQDDYDVRDRTS